MSLIADFVRIKENSIKAYENISAGAFKADRAFHKNSKTHEYMRQISPDIDLSEALCGAAADKENIFAYGDNISFMKYLLDECGMKGKIKLIYIDPPFFSKANYEAVLRNDTAATDIVDGSSEKNHNKKVKRFAYTDIWEQGMEEYLTMLTSRLMLMRDLLADDGTIWVHLDWHSVHYVKIIMDDIFGDGNFINEIIWQYKSGGSSKKHFARKHDNILVYGKTKKYYLSLPKEKSYNRGLKPYRFKGVEEFCDDIGWYTLVNMKDVWNIDMVGRTAKERTGYATQKPEALLERIIQASSREGDTVADFFCGSGTLGMTAERLGRSWICSDIGSAAAEACVKRFTANELAFTLLTETDREDKQNISMNIRKNI